MTDTTNIIATQTRIEMMLGALNACRAPEYHQETLTALVAERDRLKTRVMELEKELAADTMAVIAEMRKGEQDGK